jgi:hypothetical protein
MDLELIIKTIDEFYPDSAFHRRVKRRAKNILVELGREKPNFKRIERMFIAFDRMGENRNL